jgi:hypothetical protein
MAYVPPRAVDNSPPQLTNMSVDPAWKPVEATLHMDPMRVNDKRVIPGKTISNALADVNGGGKLFQLTGVSIGDKGGIVNDTGSRVGVTVSGGCGGHVHIRSGAGTHMVHHAVIGDSVYPTSTHMVPFNSEDVISAEQIEASTKDAKWAGVQEEDLTAGVVNFGDRIGIPTHIMGADGVAVEHPLREAAEVNAELLDVECLQTHKQGFAPDHLVMSAGNFDTLVDGAKDKLVSTPTRDIEILTKPLDKSSPSGSLGASPGGKLTIPVTVHALVHTPSVDA